MPLTRSTPFSDPRRPFLIVSPRRSTDVGSPMMHASMRSPRACSSRTTAAVPSTPAPSSSEVKKRQRSAMIWLPAHEALRGRDQRGDGDLHVRGTAPEQAAIAPGWRERVARPAIHRTRRHNVDMAGKADERRRASAACPQVPDGPTIDPLAGEAGLRQARRNHPARPIVGVSDRQNKAAPPVGGPAGCRRRSSRTMLGSLMDVFARVAASTR